MSEIPAETQETIMARMRTGAIVKAAREKRGMSVSEVAGKILCSYSYMGAIELGQRASIAYRYAYMLCKVLKITPNQLFGWPEETATQEKFSIVEPPVQVPPINSSGGSAAELTEWYVKGHKEGWSACYDYLK